MKLTYLVLAAVLGTLPISSHAAGNTISGSYTDAGAVQDTDKLLLQRGTTYYNATQNNLTAGKATALVTNPTDCGANTFATAIDTGANLTCAQVTYAGIASMTAAQLAGLMSDPTSLGALIGNVATATALAANPADCAANGLANAIAANGDLTCVALSDAIDTAFGSTRGSMLVRGATGWSVVSPNTAGYVWTDNGTGSDPTWQAAAGGGNVSNSSTPAANQMGIWVDSTHIKGVTMSGDATMDGVGAIVVSKSNGSHIAQIASTPSLYAINYWTNVTPGSEALTPVVISGLVKASSGAAPAAATACTDYVTATGTCTLTGKTLTNPATTTQTLTDGATISWDMNVGNVALVTLGGNRTMAAPTNLKAGGSYGLKVIQDATGSRTITWNSVYKWPGGTAPTLTTTAGAADVITCISFDGSTLSCSSVADVK